MLRENLVIWGRQLFIYKSYYCSLLLNKTMLFCYQRKLHGIICLEKLQIFNAQKLVLTIFVHERNSLLENK